MNFWQEKMCPVCFFQPRRDRLPAGGLCVSGTPCSRMGVGGEGLPPQASRADRCSPTLPLAPLVPQTWPGGASPCRTPPNGLLPLAASPGVSTRRKEATCHCQPSLGRQASGLTRAPEFLAPDLPLDIAGVIYGDQSLWHEVFSGDFYGRNYGKML